MHTRENALQNWLSSLNTNTSYTLTPLAGDASFRRYFRLTMGDNTHIVMDAPPDKISLNPFIRIATQLSQHGFRTPHIHAVDHEQGFMLLEDFGDQLLLKAVTSGDADKLYRQALSTLANMQQCKTEKLDCFNKPFIENELSQFQEWFLERYLGLQLTQEETNLLYQMNVWLAETIAKQPQVFVHRDFHARNIMVLPTSTTAPELGLIDFQDAIRGPWTYDAVSLLKDCYIKWPRNQLVAWAEHFHSLLPPHQFPSFDVFMRDLDRCGLQRHLRVLGTFCRLCLRDNKPNYLNDLPLTFQYVMDCLGRYDELQPFFSWMQNRIEPLFLSQTK